jgi:hypothetical protein
MLSLKRIPGMTFVFGFAVVIAGCASSAEDAAEPTDESSVGPEEIGTAAANDVDEDEATDGKTGSSAEALRRGGAVAVGGGRAVYGGGRAVRGGAVYGGARGGAVYGGGRVVRGGGAVYGGGVRGGGIYRRGTFRGGVVYGTGGIVYGAGGIYNAGSYQTADGVWVTCDIDGNCWAS